MPRYGGTRDGEPGPEGREGSPRPPHEPRTLLNGSGGQWPKARGAGPHRDPPHTHTHPACKRAPAQADGAQPSLPGHSRLVTSGLAEAWATAAFQAGEETAWKDLDYEELKGREIQTRTHPWLPQGQLHEHATKEEPEGHRGPTARTRLSWGRILPRCRERWCSIRR